VSALPQQITTQCCIAGGGPAGMMLGFLLSRAGIDVAVLEKHADFLRDFRGDTIHPSTLEVMHELGVLDEFLKRPHQEVRRLTGMIGDSAVTIADFTHLPTHCGFIALMPQWDFLDFLAEQGARYPGFRLLMRTEATDLIEEHQKIVGVLAHGPDGAVEVRASLVIAADGRHSAMRQRAGLVVEDLGAPMDVLWMRIAKRPEDAPEPLGRVEAGRVFVMLDRGDYWQCALVIAKGGFDALRVKGFDSFRELIAATARLKAERLAGLRGWDDVKLLTVAVDRLRTWYRAGLLCIGDAAHAMSPIGGVGVNLAVQDAVAAANLLAAPLAAGEVTSDHLASVQQRRSFPTKATQWLQVTIQNRVIRRVLATTGPIKMPWIIELLGRWPILQRIPARLVGVGFRSEHVQTLAVRGGDRSTPAKRA
jgi:2-polyprenyl-6-methoxyphenol hydroxylase-like FAD-dependent oxidoreductase